MIRTLAWIVHGSLAVAACGSPPGAPMPTTLIANRSTPPTTASSPYGRPCPPGMSTSLWGHEVFPGCPLPAFAPFPCNGECPRPCSRTYESQLDGTQTDRYSYVPEGVATRSRASDGRVFENCTYEAGKLAACIDVYGARHVVERDARGRITRVARQADDGGNDFDATFEYDLAGRVIAYAAPVRSKLEYDAAGRLVRERAPIDTYELEYDEQGRLASYRGVNRGYIDSRHFYDGGRLVRIEHHRHGQLDQIDELDYDDQGRPKQITTYDPSDGSSEAKLPETFEYCD